MFAFTATSLMCGLAQGEAMLIIGRALQEIGGGGRTDSDGAGRHHIRPGKPRSQAFAIYAAMTGIGSVAGLILGGILTEVSWRLVFLINVPIGLAVGLGALWALTESQGSGCRWTCRGRCWARWGARCWCWPSMRALGLGTADRRRFVRRRHARADRLRGRAAPGLQSDPAVLAVRQSGTGSRR